MRSEWKHPIPRRRDPSAHKVIKSTVVSTVDKKSNKPLRQSAEWFFVRSTFGLFWLMLSACSGATAIAPVAPPPPPPATAPLPSYANPCVVTRIFDGDTFACTTNATSAAVVVRLLYVDAPESAQRLGPASTAILRDALPIGGRIGLRFDVDSLDSFGRTLAWIETPRFANLNVWMAEDGWVTDLIIAPNSALATLVRSRVNAARAAPRGLWARGFAACLPSAFRRGDCSD